MSPTEDQILKEAVEIAMSQPELSQADMIDIVQQSTGKSHAIAEQAVKDAAEMLREDADSISSSRFSLQRLSIFTTFLDHCG